MFLLNGQNYQKQNLNFISQKKLFTLCQLLASYLFLEF